MEIVARVLREGVLIAEATYRSGFHVEVRVGKEFHRQRLHIPLSHSENVELRGTWEAALDRYFNEGRFSSKELLLPGEIPRVDSAREHKSLFRQAVHALRKDLEPFGYTVETEYR